MMPLCEMTLLSVDQRFRTDGNGHVEMAANFHAKEICGRYSHYLKRMAVQGDVLPNRLRVSAELALPEGVADNDARSSAAGTVILIVYLAPIGVAALAPRLLGERMQLTTIAALLAATAGFALLAGPTVRSAGATGLALSLVAALLFVFLILLSKPLAEAYGGLDLAFIEMAGAGLALIPVVAFTHWPHPAPAWLWLLVLGAAHTALGITLYLAALAELPATHVGIIGYLEPVGVVVCAWLFLGQRLALESLVGGALVVGAGVAIVVVGRPDRATGPVTAISATPGPGLPSPP